jgi:hypothetical protein
MLRMLLRAVGSMMCQHEWARRRERGRLYLECVNCLATTPGIPITDRAGAVPIMAERLVHADA